MQVFDGNRQTMEGAEPPAFGQRFVRGSSLRHQAVFRNQGHDGIDISICAADLFQVCLHDFAGREFLGAERIHQVHGAHKTDFV